MPPYFQGDSSSRFDFKTDCDRPRTTTEMDGTLHTDFRKSETSRGIKKYF